MVIETNNIEYKSLLKVIYKYLVEEKCPYLELSKLEKIIVDHKGKLADGVGARYENNLLFVKENDIKNALLNVNDKDFERYIFVELKDTTDEATKLLVDNIMHELFHCDAQTKMPLMHAIHASEEQDIWKRCISHFWIECTVEYNSRCISFLKSEDLLSQISKIKWEIECFFDCGNDYGNMYYFIYVSSYFVALNLALRTEYRYLENIVNDRIKEVYIELLGTCKQLLEQRIYIDDYRKIEEIEKIFKSYFESLHTKHFWV